MYPLWLARSARLLRKSLLLCAAATLLACGGLAQAQQGGNNQGGNSQGGNNGGSRITAPEINPGVMGGAAALLAGGVLLLRGRRRPA